jgi:hypothetical protein
MECPHFKKGGLKPLVFGCFDQGAMDSGGGAAIEFILDWDYIFGSI